MLTLKKIVVLTSAFIMFSTSVNNAEAALYCTDAGGCGYQACRTTPCLAPAIALGTVALAAMIAFIIQNSSGGSGHSHSH
jgi:hypothetical protein